MAALAGGLAATAGPKGAQRARRRFLSRDWRNLWALRLGFEIANVTVPTRRTFHSSASGALLSGSISMLSVVCLESALRCHWAIPQTLCRRYFAGSIKLTLMVSPLSVPVTFTFCPANCSGFF